MMINSSLGGIYKIENMRNGKCYVGSAVVLKRSEEQKQRMREGQARRRAREAAELGTAPNGESFQK